MIQKLRWKEDFFKHAKVEIITCTIKNVKGSPWDRRKIEYQIETWVYKKEWGAYGMVTMWVKIFFLTIFISFKNIIIDCFEKKTNILWGSKHVEQVGKLTKPDFKTYYKTSSQVSVVLAYKYTNKSVE